MLKEFQFEPRPPRLKGQNFVVLLLILNLKRNNIYVIQPVRYAAFENFSAVYFISNMFALILTH